MAQGSEAKIEVGQPWGYSGSLSLYVGVEAHRDYSGRLNTWQVNRRSSLRRGLGAEIADATAIADQSRVLLRIVAY